MNVGIPSPGFQILVRNTTRFLNLPSLSGKLFHHCWYNYFSLLGQISFKDITSNIFWITRIHNSPLIEHLWLDIQHKLLTPKQAILVVSWSSWFDLKCRGGGRVFKELFYLEWEKGKPKLRMFCACKLEIYYNGISSYDKSFDRNYSKMGKILATAGPWKGEDIKEIVFSGIYWMLTQ